MWVTLLIARFTTKNVYSFVRFSFVLVDCKVYYQNSFKDLTKTKEVLFCLAVTEVGHPGQGRSYFEVGKPALSHEESGLKVRCNLLLRH